MIQLTRALVLNEGSGFFSIIFMNFGFSWVLVISRFRIKKVKEFIFFQSNFTLMIRYSSTFSYEFPFRFTSRSWSFSLFGSWYFFSLTLQKIIIFFFVFLPNFSMNFHFVLLSDYDLLFPFLGLDRFFFLSLFKRSWSFSLFASWSFFSPLVKRLWSLFIFECWSVFFFHSSKDYDLCSSLDLDCCFFLKNFFALPFNGH